MTLVAGDSGKRGSSSSFSLLGTVAENFLDNRWIHDERDDLHFGAALFTGQRVDFVDATEHRRPESSEAPTFGSIWESFLRGRGLSLGRVLLPELAPTPSRGI